MPQSFFSFTKLAIKAAVQSCLIRDCHLSVLLSFYLLNVCRKTKTLRGPILCWMNLVSVLMC